MLKLLLTLISMKSLVTKLSILLLERATSKMRNRIVCKTPAHTYDGPSVKERTKNLIFKIVLVLPSL